MRLLILLLLPELQHLLAPTLDLGIRLATITELLSAMWAPPPTAPRLARRSGASRLLRGTGRRASERADRRGTWTCTLQFMSA